MSSHSEAIEGNQCWANGRQGISLEQGLDCRNTPSIAVIRDNRCYSNVRSGINLASSQSAAIEGNACWDNGSCGIDVKPLFQVHDQPSTARVRDNRLQGNRVNAIHFVDSHGEISGNRCKGNGHDNARVELPVRDPGFAPPRVGDNPVDDSLDLRSLFLPDLLASLRARMPRAGHGRSSFEGLAGFLTSGCSHCFRTFWIGHYHAPDPFVPDEPTPDARHWRIGFDRDGELELAALPVRPEGLLPDLLRRIDRLRRTRQKAGAGGRMRSFALVITDDRDVGALCDALRESAAGAGDFVAPGERMAPPLTVDMAAGDAPLRERLSAALMQGRSRGRDRATALGKAATGPALAVAAGLAGLWLSPWRAGIAAWLGGGADWLARGLLALSALAGLLAAFSILDLFLPTHLRARAEEEGAGGKIADAVKQAFGGAVVPIVSAIAKLVPAARRTALADWADLRWQARRLFASADVVPLYLSDVTRWREGDLDWLGRLARALPGQERLLLFIELDGRLSIRPLLVDPPDRPWTSGIELYLFDEPDKLALATLIADASMPAADSGGADIALLGATGEDAAFVRTELRNDAWCPTDMLPTLPLASAPTMRLRLRQLLSRASNQQLGSDLVTRVFPAAQTFFTGDHGVPQLDMETIARPFELARDARALGFAVAGDFRQISGRTGYRRQIGALLRDVWPSDSDWREYVASSLRFGIWSGATDTAAILRKPLDVMSALTARRKLEALGFLGRDLRAVATEDCPLHGDELYSTAWAELRDAVERLPCGPQDAAIVVAFLGAASACDDRPLPLAARLTSQIEAMLADPARMLATPAADACDAFCHVSTRQLIDLRQLEPAMRERALARALATTWRGAPADLAKVFSAWSGQGANVRSLAELFSGADSDEAIDRLLELHARNPIRTAFALANAAVGHVIADHRLQDTKVSGDPRLAEVAQTLVRLHALGLDGATNFGRNYAAGASVAAISSPRAFAYITASGAADRIRMRLTRTIDARLEDLEGLFELQIETPVTPAAAQPSAQALEAA